VNQVFNMSIFNMSIFDPFQLEKEECPPELSLLEGRA
jgi:hypothetical protein